MFEKKTKKIKEQEETIRSLRLINVSLEEDLKSAREEAYKTAKKPATRKKTK